MKLSKAEKKAIGRMRDGGGSGVIDRYGRVIVAGEILPHTPDTFLRLVSKGIITGGGGRLSLNVSEAKNDQP
jgi:hypothetical protein